MNECEVPVNTFFCEEIYNFYQYYLGFFWVIYCLLSMPLLFLLLNCSN